MTGYHLIDVFFFVFLSLTAKQITLKTGAVSLPHNSNRCIIARWIHRRRVLPCLLQHECDTVDYQLCHIKVVIASPLLLL